MRKFINALAIYTIVLGALFVTGTIALRIGLDAGHCTGYVDCSSAGQALRTYGGFTVNFPFLARLLMPLGYLTAALAVVLLPIGWLLSAERNKYKLSLILVIISTVITFWALRADTAYPTDTHYPIHPEAFFGL